MKRFANCLLLAVVAVLFPSVAHAHTGVGETSGFMNGVIHPVTGLDHICAMVAVGLWAVQRGGKAIWLVPLTFVSVMALGGWLGMMGHSLPFVEQGIVASILILGVLIVGLFALFHGHAHGAEMPDTASGLLYGLGFIFSTLLLHLCGIALGLSAQRFGTPQLIRYAGVAIIACGLFLCVGG